MSAPEHNASSRATSTPGTARLAMIVLAIAAGVGIGSSTIGDPRLSATAVVAAALVAATAIMPSLAAYLWLAVCPLIVGIARGGSFSVLRPNEALLLLSLVGVALFGLRSAMVREGSLPRLNAVDLSMGGLVLFGSILPLALRYGRDLPLTEDDVLYAVVFGKYAALYALFRVCIRTPRQVENCLRLALVAGSVVAIIALLQVRDLFSIPQLLSQYYDSPFEGSTGATALRGSSTIASSFGLADTMAINLAISLAWLSLGSRFRPALVAAAVLFLAGSVSAGSFSGFIGCAVAIAVVGLVAKPGRVMIALGASSAIIVVAGFWPVIAVRLAGFNNRYGLPKGWIGRLDNLERFFWPELFSDFNWLLGVRPAARVPAPEAWREWVYIESGYTWLLWTGGVPLLIAFVVFAWIVAKQSLRTVRSQAGAPAIAGVATLAAIAMIFVLMLFDPHLTVRGAADLFFPILALSLVRGKDVQRAQGSELGLMAIPD